MANVFIHFEPVGPINGELEIGKTDLPPYIIPGSPEEPNWRRNNPDGHHVSSRLCPDTCQGLDDVLTFVCSL